MHRFIKKYGSKAVVVAIAFILVAAMASTMLVKIAVSALTSSLSALWDGSPTENSGGSSFDMEAAVRSGQTIKVTKKQRRDMNLADGMSVEKIVESVLEPFGKEGDIPDKRLMLETITTVLVPPSDNEIRQARASYENMLLANKRASISNARIETFKEELEGDAQLFGDEREKYIDEKVREYKFGDELIAELVTVSLSEDEMATVDGMVESFIQANSKQKEKSSYREFVFSGETLRKEMNRYHSPWQMAFYLGEYLCLDCNYGNGRLDEEVLNEVCRYLNDKLEYNLAIEFWNMEDGQKISWEDHAAMLTSSDGIVCYVDSIIEYDEPQENSNGEKILMEKSFVPIIRAREIITWVDRIEYTMLPSRTGVSDFSLVCVTHPGEGTAFNSIMDEIILKKGNLKKFCDDLEDMPSGREVYFTFMDAVDRREIKKNAERYFIISREYIESKVMTTSEKMVCSVALDQVGREAGVLREGFDRPLDNGELIHYSYSKLGIDISTNGNHSVEDIAAWCELCGCEIYGVSSAEGYRPGDIFFWDGDADGVADEAALYMGDINGIGVVVEVEERKGGHAVCRLLHDEDQLLLVARPLALGF